MKAMILAAGKGTRLRPLTDVVPKPLIRIQGKPLIDYHIEALAKIGITDLVINLHHLGGRIKTYLGTGEKYGVHIQYSPEKVPLEMAGGIIQALPLLGTEPFIVISADVFTNYDYAALLHQPVDLAHMIVLPNPPDHPLGDFALQGHELTCPEQDRPYTFAGIGLYSPALFEGWPIQPQGILPLICSPKARGRVTGEIFEGLWHNVGQLHQVKRLNMAS